MSVQRVRTQPSTAVGGVIVGVDTHQLTHQVALIDGHHRRVGSQEFPATAAGYRELVGLLHG